MDKKLPQSLTFWHGEFNNDLMANSNWNSKINRDFCWFNYREINVFHEAVFNLKLMDIPVPPVFNTAQCSGSATQHPPPHPPPQLWLPPIPYHPHLRALSTSMVLNAPIWLLLVFKAGTSSLYSWTRSSFIYPSGDIKSSLPSSSAAASSAATSPILLLIPLLYIIPLFTLNGLVVGIHRLLLL